MNKRIIGSLFIMIMSVNVYGNALDDMFNNGKFNGQIRTGYIYDDMKNENSPINYATALGGQLKYETASLYGVSLGAAFYTSHRITFLSGDDEKYNNELSGDTHYDLLAEAYMNYQYDSFNLRVGRQLIDTPYADSDDIRMTPNTFEGIVASYGMGDFTVIGAYLTKWQGPDAGSYEFEDLIPEEGGVTMLASVYEESDVEAGVWYYHVDNIADVFYADIAKTYSINDSMSLTGALQFADQSEINHSGIEGTLYGAMLEIGYQGFTFGLAYDKLNVDHDKEYFGGFGGGVGFVNMFETTAGVFSARQDITAWKSTIAYDFTDFGMNGMTLLYDFGTFEGDVQYKAKEHNLIFSYAPLETWDVEIAYAYIDDVDKNIAEDEITQLPTDASIHRVLARVNYNF